MDEYPFRKLAHLVEQIGPVRFLALLNPKNTGRVRNFCEELLAAKPRADIFAELLAACQVEVVESGFNEEHYPLEPITDDEDQWEVYEYRFSETVNGEDALKNLEKMGYRLLNGSRRALEFLATHPDRLDHPIIITDRWQHPLGGSYVPIMGRNANLTYLDKDIGSHCGWLVLRRKAAA